MNTDLRRRGAALRRGVLALLAASVMASAAASESVSLTERLLRIDRATSWKPAGEIRVGFATGHPQGMVRIGQDFFVSSVQIERPTVRYPEPRGGFDRDVGAGAGRLFKVGPDGTRLGEIRLGEGDSYHPGGLDYDGEFIWLAVAEYRPDSRAIVYRVDPRTMTATEVLRVADHIGAVAYDRRTRTLQGVSWGGRRFYQWRLGADGRAAAPVVTANRAHYVDYQDCRSLGSSRMLCSGLADYRPSPPARPFSLGGWELIDLRDHRAIWQAPVLLWAPSGRPMTQNPFDVVATPNGLRAYFMPDDDVSSIYIYDIDLP